MAAVAEAKAAVLKVYTADEHGDEHQLLIILRYGVVYLAGYFLRREAGRSHHAEEVPHNGHEKAGGNALATYIGHCKIQVLVLDEVVVEVSSNFLGGRHGGVKVNVLPVREGGEGPGNHAHLDVTGNLELSFYPFTLCRGGG